MSNKNILITEPGHPECVHPTSEWTLFIRHLTDFKLEIEDRIPGYFSAQPLRLCLQEKRTIDMARINDVWRMLAQALGMHLQIVTDGEQQNYVDRLFNLRTGKCLRHLERLAQVTTDMVPESSLKAEVSISLISLREFIAASLPKSERVTTEIADWRSRFEQRQILLPDGIVLNYYAGGEGQKTLVLLNAYGQSFRYWERLIPTISRWFRIILWTPRGNDGDTIGLKVASSQAVHADDLEKVLSQEKIENCTLLAWCTGPKLALEYYQRYPDRIASMVFVAASFKGLRQHKSLETEYEKHLESLLEMIEEYPETANAALEYLKGTLLSQGNQACSTDEGAAMSDRDLQQALSAVNVSLQELVLHPFHASSVVAYAKQMREFWNHDVVTILDKVKVPVLFVGGDCDRIASQAIAKLVAGMMPEAKYLEIKGGSHYLHYDRWDLLADVIGQVVNTGGKR